MKEVTIQIKKLTDDATIPVFHTDGSSGMDIAYPYDMSIILKPSERVTIPTGLAIAVEKGYELQIRPRSGFAAKSGIMVLDSPGTIDSDYRGEIGIILYNTGKEPFVINKGDRVAQGVIAEVIKPRFVVTDSLPESARGTGGYGHTGVSVIREEHYDD